MRLSAAAASSLPTHRSFFERDEDFSLLQVAVVHDRADRPNGVAKPDQTVEAGWTHYPVLHKGHPILFAFYTTNGYRSQSDYAHLPGHAYFCPLRRRRQTGGDEIIFNLHDNCWWLYTNGSIRRLISYLAIRTRRSESQKHSGYCGNQYFAVWGGLQQRRAVYNH
ncbi:uncharacterized protein G6M90_00g025560 [Metarhizium brunneum]|uniref:Neprosin PEP catalytic domain-containing protein n=1 Tax=Metarhizium brunneum TaxID=500148 RepID=A0A7D5UQD3_9HYPO